MFVDSGIGGRLRILSELMSCHDVEYFKLRSCKIVCWRNECFEVASGEPGFCNAGVALTLVKSTFLGF